MLNTSTRIIGSCIPRKNQCYDKWEKLSYEQTPFHIVLHENKAIEIQCHFVWKIKYASYNENNGTYKNRYRYRIDS